MRRGWYLPVKAGVDFLFSLALAVPGAPVALVAAVLVKLTSRGPALYSQTRLGRHGKPFRIYKIRTMVHECEKHSGPQWASAGDSRITPLGRVLRKLHIDELPQLWNVLRGDMSLVGPRPERPEFVPQLEQAIPCYRDRLLVRPGVTGLAQIQLPADTDLASVRRKLAYDLHYVQHVGFWLDVRILVGTGFYVLRVPFRVTRALLRVPSGRPVEQAYQRLVHGLEPMPRLHSV